MDENERKLVNIIFKTRMEMLNLNKKKRGQHRKLLS